MWSIANYSLTFKIYFIYAKAVQYPKFKVISIKIANNLTKFRRLEFEK